MRIPEYNLWKTAESVGFHFPEREHASDYGGAILDGIRVELEHTPDRRVAAVIAAHHLDEREDYYEVHEKAGL